MPRIANRIHHFLSYLLPVPLVPRLLGPALGDVPIDAKVRVLPLFSLELFLDIRQAKQFSQVVRVGFLYKIPVRKIVLLDAFRRARFQRTFDGIAREIVGAVVALHTQKRPGVVKTNFSKLLKVLSRHERSLAPPLR